MNATSDKKITEVQLNEERDIPQEIIRTQKTAYEHFSQAEKLLKSAAVHNLSDNDSQRNRDLFDKEESVIAEAMMKNVVIARPTIPTLGDEALSLYDQEWGIVATSPVLPMLESLDDIQPIESQTIREVFKHGVPDTFITFMKRLKDEIKSKSGVIDALNETSAGLELMHLFIIDLLGQKTNSAQIFRNKFNADYEKLKVIPKWLKYFSIFFIFALNGFFMYWMLLRAVYKGSEWQIQFIKVVISQLAIEIFLFETIECAWIHYIVPESVRIEVRKAIYVLEIIAANVETLLLSHHQSFRSTHNNNNNTNKEEFDATNYLFISKQLASIRPELIESRIILAYRNHFPGLISYTWPHYQEILREKKIEQNSHFFHSSLNHHLPHSNHLSHMMDSSFAHKLRDKSNYFFVLVFTLTAGISYMLQSFGVLPMRYQKVLIRAAQTSILSGLTLLFLFAKKHLVLISAIVIIFLLLGGMIGIRYFGLRQDRDLVNILDKEQDELERELHVVHSNNNPKNNNKIERQEEENEDIERVLPNPNNTVDDLQGFLGKEDDDDDDQKSMRELHKMFSRTNLV